MKINISPVKRGGTRLQTHPVTTGRAIASPPVSFSSGHQAVPPVSSKSSGILGRLAAYLLLGGISQAGLLPAVVHAQSPTAAVSPAAVLPELPEQVFAESRSESKLSPPEIDRAIRDYMASVPTLKLKPTGALMEDFYQLIHARGELNKLWHLENNGRIISRQALSDHLDKHHPEGKALIGQLGKSLLQKDPGFAKRAELYFYSVDHLREENIYQALPENIRTADVTRLRQIHVDGQKRYEVVSEQLDRMRQLLAEISHKNPAAMRATIDRRRVDPLDSGKTIPLPEYVRTVSSSQQQEDSIGGTASKRSADVKALIALVRETGSLTEALDKFQTLTFPIENDDNMAIAQAPVGTYRVNGQRHEIFRKNENANPKDHRIAIFIPTLGHFENDPARFDASMRDLRDTITDPAQGYRVDQVYYVTPPDETELQFKGSLKAKIIATIQSAKRYREECLQKIPEADRPNHTFSCFLAWEGHGEAVSIKTGKAITPDEPGYYDQGTANFTLEVDKTQDFEDKERKMLHLALAGYQVEESVHACESAAATTMETPRNSVDTRHIGLAYKEIQMGDDRRKGRLRL